MQRVFVLDLEKNPLMPCHPARARELLNKGKAAVYKCYPFTIILKNRVGGDVQPAELKFDPGSKTTGIALVGQFERGQEIVFGANLNHRGQKIKQDLESRRANRRARRNRKTRYRPARFYNRCRNKGWLPPSLMSRVFNVETWAKRLQRLIPITSIAVETVRFDTQKMQNSEVSGVEYQQGVLAGYEVREYLLEKWGRKCAYCGAENVPLEIEHIQPKSKGGTNRVSNLTIACRNCNKKKSNRSISDFLKRKPTVLKRIKAQTQKSLKDTAAVNATRYAIGNVLKSFGLPVTFWSGGRTKFNRTQQKYPKDHWIDAACVGETGANIYIPNTLKPLIITAIGHGSRQMCRVDKYGFPRTTAKKTKVVKGFQTGDIVKAIVTKGKKIGTYIGRVAVRTNGFFNISTKNGTTQGISWKSCQRLQSVDGYNYLT
ncbi:HNH endonuclease [Candidatus Thiomargarita nelsonii]|uniref:HNH endonuclease n=1 Tax=Candidatus Thiomargarita nelsonii TaxID=1003181 RepID=A0A176RVQ6_9GAMM|nr:HNH endonuclease [Candidatus Thiomargarita nelsonii]